MTYAFTFDASACSGCKACQVACKDKNQLPVGVLWRRVIEVSGGEWTRQNDAWINNVFAYNLSLACNHCVHPKCAGVCPVNAFVIRPDGIVFIDTSRCMGCGYCSWACPYGVPQYNPQQGTMTKCDFCMDSLDAGLPPSCVAACPLRVLNFVSTEEQNLNIVGQTLWTLPAAEHPFPLPDNSHTEPHLAIQPHLGMSLPLEKTIANREEIRSQKPKSENSLVAFTLLAQTAVGAFWAAQWMFTSLWNLIQFDAWILRLVPYLIVGACLGIAGLFSIAHLGSKHNAWRALTHLRKSWLSREILFVDLFGAGWLLSMVPLPWQALTILRAATLLSGFALIYSMAQVYRLQTMPSWNTWRTPTEFFITAFLLGQLLMWNVLLCESQFSGIVLPPFSIQLSSGFTLTLLACELGLGLSAKENAHRTVHRLRVGMIGAAMVGTGILFSASNQAVAWISLVVILIVIAEEIVGRWLFYAALHERSLA
jgi:DMSO reductase iron-sulfur subunit